MKHNAKVVLTLLALAIVPVTCSFLFSGKNEDKVAQPAVEPASEPEEVEEPIGEEPEPETPSPAAAETARSLAEKPRAPQRKPIRLADAGKVKSTTKVPIFKGFEHPRYQQYDALIAQFVDDFNKRRASWAGGTAGQGNSIAPLTAAQVKAHMIQETGGGDVKSRTAWNKDPLQVNVPGDWNPYKKYLGLKQPRRCNEGTGAKNLKAGLMLLTRKGFGVSGQPAANRPDGAFDGWPRALQRYNGRSDKAADGRKYSDAYSDRIRKRAKDPSVEVPIPIPTKRR